ncbi:MAG: phosphatidate cytidylyltransferase [bacterium]|nr:phosphatidate cytidylyltransferase [bacterium]
MLRYRLISSFVLTISLIVIVMYSHGWTNIFLPTAFSVLCLTALLEFYHFMEQKGYRPLRTWGVAFSIAYVFVIYLVSLNMLPKVEDLALLPVYVAVFSAALTITFRQEISTALASLASSLAGFLYITWLLTFNLRIILWRARPLPDGQVSLVDGRYFFLYFIILLKSTDIAAYFYGTHFGRHKLAPKISPKKTIEGSIAGLLTSALLGAFLTPLMPSVAPLYAKLAATLLPGPPTWSVVSLGCLTGILLSILGQLGDLAESLWKRDAQVKDSGGVIPGMGGALDVLDSFLFAAPAMYFFMKMLERL